MNSCREVTVPSTATSESKEKKKKNKRKTIGSCAMKLSTDPQSVAARRRRHRISDRFKILQSLVPGGSKMDTVTMLEEAIQYVKFLKAQICFHQAIIARSSVDHHHNHHHHPALAFPPLNFSYNQQFNDGFGYNKDDNVNYGNQVDQALTSSTDYNQVPAAGLVTGSWFDRVPFDA